jgi:hypothetical protein
MRLIIFRILFFIVVLMVPVVGSSQSECLHFDDGSYVGIGSNSINEARTIELWFKLDEDFDQYETTIQSLLVRNTSGCDECDEVTVALMSNGGTSLHGHLQFKWQKDGNVPIKIFSDTNAWSGGQWHHVAAVISEVDGMMMFIDGVKQQDVNQSQTQPITTSDTLARIGRWGTAPNNPRYFHGNIETVRISANARYNANFFPSCLDTLPDSNTMSLWLFNEGVGQIAGDIGNNTINGSIVGATWVTDSICADSGSVADSTLNTVLIYNQNVGVELFPNPSTDVTTIKVHENADISDVFVYDQQGRLLLSEHFTLNNSKVKLDVSLLPAGFYSISVHTTQGFNSAKLSIVR